MDERRLVDFRRRPGAAEAAFASQAGRQRSDGVDFDAFLGDTAFDTDRRSACLDALHGLPLELIRKIPALLLLRWALLAVTRKLIMGVQHSRAGSSFVTDGTHTSSLLRGAYDRA